MENQVLEFIKRRFPIDSDWMNGNCYFFAIILADTFNGEIYYECIDGHFVCLINNTFYDWKGIYKKEIDGVCIKWNEFKEYDYLQYERIINDCCR